MRYDRDYRSRRRYRRRTRGDLIGRGEYGLDYESPSAPPERGYGMGYGGTMRSRGSYQAGQLRSGLNPVDEFEFGDGYVGGRGYGGTNPDLVHGYRVGGLRGREVRGEGPAGGREAWGGPSRGGANWGEAAAGVGEPYGPARYGYGPYYERLWRRRRPDEEIKEEVEEALFYDTWVDADRIEVEVKDGVVTLRGTLPHYEEVRYAVDDAWDVEGVRGVRSELEVEEGAGRQRIGLRRPRRGGGMTEGAAAGPGEEVEEEGEAMSATVAGEERKVEASGSARTRRRSARSGEARGAVDEEVGREEGAEQGEDGV